MTAEVFSGTKTLVIPCSPCHQKPHSKTSWLQSASL